jgi:segregation and condensation protein A
VLAATASPRPTITLPVFEGPLALLLHLIRSHKIEIADIPIATITDQYVEYLALMESLDLDIAGEFLVMAATLMEIKSRLLLPRPEPMVEDDEGVDPRAELIARLLEYERFQAVAETLRERAEESRRSFARTAVEQWEGAIPLVELKPADLLDALRRMRLTEEETEEGGGRRGPALRVRRQQINLRQRMSEIVRRLETADRPIAFSALLRAHRTENGRLTRHEVLVTFLAVLELVRLGEISAWQEEGLGEIILAKATSVPSIPFEGNSAG